MVREGRLGVVTVSKLHRKSSDLAHSWDAEGMSLLNCPFCECLNMCVSDTDSQIQAILLRYFLKENMNIFFYFNTQNSYEEAKYFLE